MKLTIVLIIAAFLQVSAEGYSQKITLQENNISLQQLFEKIRAQTDYKFFYADEILANTRKVNIKVINGSIEEVLDASLKHQQLAYTISERTVFIRKSREVPVEELATPPPPVEIRGRVVNEQGEPLQNASVLIAGTKTGTTTNANGNFTITAPNNNNIILEISSVGYQTKRVSIGNQTNINITMEVDVTGLSNVVVVGYGTVRKIDLTGSVGTVNMSDVQKAPVSSFAQALAGRVAGVQVNSTDGQPGGGVNIMIRGAGSLTQSTTPLYVVDGFPIENLDPSTLNPEDIESISILKDASSTAIYGSRGANGVVLIQTKRGKQGKAVTSLTGSLGYQLPPPSIPMMSPYEFVKYQQELDPISYATPIYFAQGKTLDDYKNVQGINWQDQVIQTGVMQTYNLAIRGGTDQTKYSISGNIFDQKGVIINTGLQRYSGNVKIDQAVSNKIKVGVTVDYTETKTSGQVIRSLYTSNATASALVRAWMYRPITADPNEDLLADEGDQSMITPSDFRINPVIDLNNQYQHTITDVLRSNAYVSYDITRHFTFKSQAGIMQIKTREEQFYNSKTSQGSPINPSNTNGVWGYLRTVDGRSWSNENTLNYKQSFGGHAIDGLLLFGLNSYKTFSNSFRGTNLPNESKRMDGLDESTTASFTSPAISNTINTMASYAAQIKYNYRSKYLLTVNFRADGSSKFLDHWGYFPSGAVAWNMDNEDFFKNALPFISNSKLRVSYGETGNNRVGDFAALPTLVLNNTGQGYSFNNAVPTAGAYVGSLGNAKLQWEKTKQLDIGYEFGVLNNRISLEVDLYRRTTENLLLAARLPPSSGFTSATQNVGKLRNDGIEFTLNTINVNSGAFNWTSSFNISFNRNKIIALSYGLPSLSNTVTYLSQFGQPLYLHKVGEPIGMMIGYVWEGNYQYPDFDNPAPDVYVLKSTVPDNGSGRNTVQPGDIKLKDINGDGTVNAADLTVIGRGQPIHIGGFSNNFTYKGFSLNLFFQWSYGNNIYNANRLLLEGNSNGFHGINQYASYANRWTPENQTNENYRTRGQGFIGYFSSKNLEDGSYLRLKTASLSYALPGWLTKKLYLSDLVLDISAQNFITWTKYSGLDPEVSTANNVLQPGYDFSGYPQAKTIVIGLKASF